ncbi:hypothetical protein ASZ90_010065 [hydrocarbon metagenome]|uniref:Uncharacterized protein n=1 Tax=hydrocarbon metagenome TaxID=938273 RepID=A0A0W8FH53_9ZZZZ
MFFIILLGLYAHLYYNNIYIIYPINDIPGYDRIEYSVYTG